MPVVNIDRENLFAALGRRYTLEEFEGVCFDFGIELEEETSLAKILKKETSTASTTLSDKPIYRIDIPANRYDLLCPEGLTRALKIYLGLEKTPVYTTIAPKNPVVLNVNKAQVDQIRPHVVAAVLRDITLTQEAYDNFIELQEKLHANLCRKRTLVAIGTHDLDTLKAPFTYEALSPKDIRFKPLNQDKEMDGNELMQFYENDKRLSKFLPIIKSSPVYPVMYDAGRKVMSLPPIINSDHSKIKLTTKNIFIECTATDLTKAKTVLNTVVCMFSGYCKVPFSVEQVQVNTGTEKIMYPNLQPRTFQTTSTYINKSIGISISTPEIITLLSKMSLSASPSLLVSVPPTRSDILHECDIMEDVAIAYGFNNIPETMPKTNTVAEANGMNKLGDMIRRECAQMGWCECLPLILCSHDENFAHLNVPDTGSTAVLLANPKTAEYQVVRTSLLPGILKTIKENKHCPLPLKLFEVSDVVFKDDSVERRARNQRNIGAVWCGRTSGFGNIHGLLDRLMLILSIPRGRYTIRESNYAMFFPNRQADVVLDGKVIGRFGIFVPGVVEKFGIGGLACSGLEVCLEGFL